MKSLFSDADEKLILEAVGTGIAAVAITINEGPVCVMTKDDAETTIERAHHLAKAWIKKCEEIEREHDRQADSTSS